MRKRSDFLTTAVGVSGTLLLITCIANSRLFNGQPTEKVENITQLAKTLFGTNALGTLFGVTTLLVIIREATKNKK